ncbi:MAG: hypothetical protein GXO81_11165 [Chlorobi bacterium]|nr:hypothetical protein [Chlorobiota bacterium]
MKEIGNTCGRNRSCADIGDLNKDKAVGDTVFIPDGSTVSSEYRCAMDIL